MWWIKLLKDITGHKAGEIVSLPEANAKALVDAGVAEKTDEPDSVKQVRSQQAELQGNVEAFVKQVVADAVVATVKEIMPKPDPKRPTDIKTHDNADDDPTCGFKTITEQAIAVKRWCTNAAQDERLKRMIAKAPSTYAQEGIGADGGFLLAPNFAAEMLRHTFPDGGIFNRCRSFTTSSNGLTIPKDETTPWSTSGVKAYWQSEAAQATQTKPVFGQATLSLSKLTALVPVTDEMNTDAFIGLGEYLNTLAGDRIRFKVDEAIINGTGAGQPLGIINSGALVSQAKETSQTADTIVTENVAKMLSRVPMDNIGSLVWLIHPSAFPQLVTLKIGDTPVFLPPGTSVREGLPVATLFGVPVIMSQQCQGVGDKGDIILMDCSKYIVLTKGTGIEVAMSIHLFFDYSIQAWRFNFRMAGQPWQQAAATSQYGNYAMSPFVTLDERG